MPDDPAGAHIDQVLGVRSLCLERLAGDVLAAVGQYRLRPSSIERLSPP